MWQKIKFLTRTVFNFTGNFGHANNLLWSMGLPTYSQPSHPGIYFRYYRISREYEQKYLPVPAMLPMRNSQITYQNIYLADDTKISFTVYGTFTENEFLRHWRNLNGHILDPHMLLLAECVCTCLDPQLIPHFPYLYSMWSSAMPNHCLVSPAEVILWFLVSNLFWGRL